MAGPYDLNYAPAFQDTPQTAAARGLTHLGSVLDAIMERKSREEAQKAQLAQAAALAAEDDKRQRDQLNWTMKHQGAEEDIARQRLTQDEQDKTATRAMTAMPHFDAAQEAGDIEGMKRWGGPGGIGVTERPQTPAMDMLGALTDKPAPADPLGTPPPMGYTPMGEVQAPPGVVPPPEPPASPSLLDAQLAAPKPPTYDVTVPGGPSTVYDPAASRGKRMERGGQAAGDLGNFESPSKFAPQAKREIQSELRSSLLDPKEAAKEFRARVQHLEDQANTAENARVVAASKPDQPSGNIYGQGGEVIAHAPEKKQGGDINAQNGSFIKLDQLLNRLQESYAANGMSYTPFEEKDSMLKGDYQNQRALKGQATLIFKEMAKLGALSGPDMGLVAEGIGGGLTGEQGAAKLAAARAELARQHTTFLDTHGLSGAKLMPKLTGGGGKAKPSAKSIVGKMGIE